MITTTIDNSDQKDKQSHDKQRNEVARKTTCELMKHAAQKSFIPKLMMSEFIKTFSDITLFLKNVELKWRPILTRKFEKRQALTKNVRSSTYILSMFPYPSGNLHLGHVRIYTSGDILSRYHRMLGQHVITPMGFDSFGLPAENAARERGLNPASWTKANIITMKKQLDNLALQLDWREATSNSKYYKWTQELFLNLLEANLVYKSFAKVNWDPIDKTVLADEQVDENGRSWRSGASVEKKYLRQWFIKVNAFVSSIYEAKDVEPESWKDVLAIQRNWVGQPSGWLFYLPIRVGTSNDILPVFTEAPELFLREDTKLLLTEDHWLEAVRKISHHGQIENPFNGHAMSVSFTNNSGDLPKNSFATLLDENRSVTTHDSISFERQQVLIRARLHGFGGYRTSNKYRDWLVSRQRYWGTPIPAINCDNCGLEALPKQSLPLTLPRIQGLEYNTQQMNDGHNQMTTPIGRLASEEWLKTTCPSCESIATRETETLDTLFDSSWYFLRYASEPSDEQAFNKNKVQPVWCYIGGLEHASMHLFYARFITHFLHSQKQLNFREPFKKLLVQGVVKGKTYKLNGRYLNKDEIAHVEGKENIEVNYEKMSKSKGNGVDPNDLLDKYGIDATRFCLMSYANPRTERLWRSSDEEFKDVLIYLRRVVMTVKEYHEIGAKMHGIRELQAEDLDSKKELIKMTRIKCLSRVKTYLQETYQFRQVISEYHVLLNSLRSNIKTSVVYTEEFSKSLAALIVIMSPMTPHLSEELWLHFCNTKINPLKFEQQANDERWPTQ